MLVNNFKPLLYFGTPANIAVNTNGETVPYYLTNALNMSSANGHTWTYIGRSFNYNLTTGANSYINEQEKYTYKNVVNIGNNGFANGFILFVGTGNTPVTTDDYKLDTPIPLAATSASCIQSTDGLITVTRTFRNDTENAVTIKELGVYLFTAGTGVINSSTDIYYYPIMLGRKVLSTPVIIPVGAEYTFKWVIDLAKQITFTDETEE